MSETYTLTVCGFAGKPRWCVYLNNTRIAGQKPWGGSSDLTDFKVEAKHIKQAIPELFAPDPRVAELEGEVERLRGEVRRLSTPDLYWDEDGEDFRDGDDYDIWLGGIFRVEIGKLLGFKYAAYIPTEIDPETGAFDAGDVEYFPTEADAIAAQDAAVAALQSPTEKEVG